MLNRTWNKIYSDTLIAAAHRFNIGFCVRF